MVDVIIDQDKCDGEDCAECVDICPSDIFHIEDGKIKTENEDMCILCDICVDTCPNSCIKTIED